MKKLLGIMAVCALTASAFAQGTVTFANAATTGPVQQWSSTTSSTLIAVPKSGGHVELVAAPIGTALPDPLFTVGAGGLVTANYQTLGSFLAANPGWAAVATTAITSLTAGQFGGGVVTIANINEAAHAEYFVVGWTGGSATVDAAITAATGNQASSFLGESAIFTTTTADPLSTPAGNPVNLNTTFTGMSLAPLNVPEPASFALAGLGLAALLAFRRRS